MFGKVPKVGAQRFTRGVDEKIDIFWISGQNFSFNLSKHITLNFILFQCQSMLRFHKNNNNHIFTVPPVFVPEHEVIRLDLDHYQKKRRQTQQKVLVILWRL